MKLIIHTLKNIEININYNSSVETSDGSKHEETATFKYVGGLSVTGSYEFIDDEGKTHKVKYIADEKGYRPEIID